MHRTTSRFLRRTRPAAAAGDVAYLAPPPASAPPRGRNARPAADGTVLRLNAGAPTLHRYAGPPAHRTRGFFGVGIYQPKRDVNVGGLLRTAQVYGARFVFTVGARYDRRDAADTPNVAAHTPLFHYDTVDALMERLPHGCPLIGVELDDRAVPLAKLVHPLRAVYLLGAEDYGLPPAVRDRCHYLVQVESAQPYSLNVATAGGIVLHDRHVRALQPRTSR